MLFILCISVKISEWNVMKFNLTSFCIPLLPRTLSASLMTLELNGTRVRLF